VVPIYVQSVKKNINKTMKSTRVLEIEYNELQKAIKDGKHEYHCFYLATINKKKPKIRTVVLRALNENKNTLSFHTDLRSDKVKEIQLNRNVSALFYDKKRRIQIRIQGDAQLDKNSNKLKKIWSSMRPESKLCYMGPFAPGEKLDQFQPNLPNHNAQNITTKNNKKGYENFCRVTIYLESLDWLQLEHSGHQRIYFSFNKNSKPIWIAS
tara:strand:- start:82 stop:711 length:630 start_codon:yes stop_codon:yes gene_type:complete